MGYLKESASREPIGRLIVTIYKLGSNARLATVAKEVDLSQLDLASAIAEAEWGGLLSRAERDGGVFLNLTSQGYARAEAIMSPS